MDELEINDELMKINNIHRSLDAENIITYIILLETNKTKLSQGQILWINSRIASLNEKQRKQVADGLENIDVELAKSPLSCKTTSFGCLKEDV